MIWLVACVIAGEIILYLILLWAARVKVPWVPASPGWFYFLLTLGTFGMGGASFFAYLDTYHKLSKFRVEGSRYITVRDMLGVLKDMETGSRGYLLTGRSAYLAPYTAARDDVEVRCKRLKDAYAGSDDAAVAERFCMLAKARAGEVENIVGLRKAGKGKEAEAAILTDEGRRTMETVREVAGLLAGRALGEYNRVQSEIIVLAETRLWMAGLVVLGSVIQMVLGALTGRLVPPKGHGDPKEAPPAVLPPESPPGLGPGDRFSFP